MNPIYNPSQAVCLHQPLLEANEIHELLPLLRERYRPTHLLGKMPGRRTLLAQDCTTGTPVVIKLLSFGEELSWDDVKLFEREGKTLQNIDHPAIPRHIDFFEYRTDKQAGFALVQSYIAARSLEQHVSQGRAFQELELRQFAKQLLKILMVLHRRRPPLIHRDIKPSNILLANAATDGAPDTEAIQSSIHLIDFGSVQTLTSREGGTMTVVGTYGYMPPEQFGGKAVPASDLYSLGTTLVYLATGQHPAELPQRNLRLQFEPLAPHLSERFVAWLRQLIEPSLSKRFDSAKAALQALEQTPISSFLLPIHQRSLPPEPVTNSMRAEWREHSLMIGMPRNRISLYQEREAINNPLVRWVDQGKDGWGWGCLGVMVAVPGICLVMGIFVLWSDLLFRGDVFTLLALMPVIMYVCFLLWKFWKFCQQQRQRRQQSTVEIDINHLKIFGEGRLLHQFQRQQIWRLQSEHAPYSGKVYLDVGSQRLLLNTASPAERDWLAKLLRKVLEVPLES